MVEMYIGEVSSKGKIEKHQQTTSTQSEKFRHGRTMVTLQRVQISLSKPTQLSPSKLKSHQIRMLSADPFQKPNSIRRSVEELKASVEGAVLAAVSTEEAHVESGLFPLLGGYMTCF